VVLEALRRPQASVESLRAACAESQHRIAELRGRLARN
jgi:hypothetical protein